jgi:hypothetical protein
MNEPKIEGGRREGGKEEANAGWNSTVTYIVTFNCNRIIKAY